MNKKPILLIACTHSLGAKFLHGQLEYMKKNNFEVYVLCSEGIEIRKLCEEENVIFIPFPFERNISLIKDFVALFKLIKVIRKINPDIINTGTPKAGLLVSLAGRILRKFPVIFTLRGLRSDTLDGLKGFVVKSMETFTCSLADVVIPISPSLCATAVEKGILKEEKAIILGKGSSNGVNVDYFTSTFTKEKIEIERNKLQINKADIVFSFIGRINNDKGVVELYKTFNKLTEKYNNIKLLIAGDFEKEDAIESDIKSKIENDKNVILLGYQENVKNVYEIVDVLILFSKREGFGNILIEAASMNTAVIASNISGCKDAVSDRTNGFLVSDVNELYDKMELYIVDYGLIIKHSQNGRLWAIENFKSEIIWEAQLNLYNGLLINKN